MLLRLKIYLIVLKVLHLNADVPIRGLMKKMKTITFYSYKGGVGRTLLLSNFAEYLAYYGKKVIIADFDLEAPGIHFKFGLYPEFIENKGLVDFINEAINDFKSIYSISPFINKIPSKPGKEYYQNIEIIPAGNAPSEEYVNKYSKIPWYDLYYGFKIKKNQFHNIIDQNISGFKIFLLLQALIEDLKPPIDYLLIDSRTGITDIGGTAITVLPDTLVCLFNNNKENIYGLQTVIRSAKNTNLRINKPKIKIVPVLTRIPEGSQVNIDFLINEINKGLTEEDKINQKELQIIRSEPTLELIEELRFSSKKTLKESVILRDYLNIFAAIEPKICKEKELEKLLKLIPLSEDVSYSNGTFLENKSTKNKIIEKGRDLKVIKPKYITYNGGKHINNFHKNQYSIFIDAIINNLTNALYNKYDYAEVKKDINWDLLGFQVNEGFFDFCAEPYYLTKTRSHFLDVIRIGLLKTFTCFISKESDVYKNGIKKLDKCSFKDTFHYLSERFIDLKIGTIGDHAAALEVYRNLDFLSVDKIEYHRNEKSLLNWLTSDNDNTHNKIAICDHAIAKYLKRDEALYKSRNYDIGIFLESTDELTFKYQEPIPVGFVYKIEDLEWRKLISKSIIKAFLAKEYKFDWSKVIEELITYHIEVFDSNTLHKQLIWDLTFEEAEYFNMPLADSLK